MFSPKRTPVVVDGTEAAAATLGGTKVSLKWASKCLYQCKICGHTAMNRTTHEYHIRKQHKIKMTLYHDTYGGGMIKRVIHTCRICFKKFNWTYGELKRHMGKNHNGLTIEEYYNAFFRGNPLELKDEGVVVQGKFKEDKEVVAAWASKCTFECKICGHTTMNRTTHGNHIMKQHRLKMKLYHDEYGHGMIRRVLHKCRICFKTFNWTYAALRSHMARSHNGLTLEEYYNNFFRWNQDELKDEGVIVADEDGDK